MSDQDGPGERTPSWCAKLLSGELPVARCDAHLGLRPEAIGYGSATWVMDVEKHHTNVHGRVGGGILAAGLDTALGTAGASVVSRSETAFTVQSSVNYLSAAHGPIVRFQGSVVKKTARFIHVEGSAHDGAGKLLARASQVMAVAERRQKQRAPSENTSE